jgi:DNA-binding protein H-NS
MYSRRLRERARRKRVIRDYQLVCKFFKKDRAKAAATVNGEVSTETKETAKRFQGYEKYAYFYQNRHENLF